MPYPIIYNLTFKIEKALSEQWLKKLEHDYLPSSVKIAEPVSTQISEIFDFPEKKSPLKY